MSYIPKVGEDCLYSLGDSNTWHKCNIIFIVGTQGVVMESKQAFEGVQYCSLLGNEAVKFKPAKTPAEIERDNGIAQMFEDAEVQGSNSAFVRLYDKGYRKQQVKPLSKSYALQEIGLNDYGYKFMVEHGFIVQGGE
jgi:hypothetical protein